MEKNVNERDSYTVLELIFSLRDYFIEGQNILNDMLNQIDISSKSPHKDRIWIEQEMATNISFREFIKYKEGPYNGVLHIDLTKKFSPMQTVRELQVVYDDSTDAYFFDNARFVIRKSGDSFIFEDISECNSRFAYKPILRIKDPNEFNRLYQRLIDEGYLTYPMIFYFFSNGLIDETILSLSMSRIELEHYDSKDNIKKDRCVLINYFIENGELYFRDTRKYPEITAGQLLNLPVDKRNIYKGYIPIIESYLNSRLDEIKTIEAQVTGKSLKKIFKEKKSKQQNNQ